MTRLKKGDPAPDISLPAIDGSTFELSSMKGRRVLLPFFRFSSCPFCNIRINRIMKRWEEFPDDAVMVGVFDAEGKVVEAHYCRDTVDHLPIDRLVSFAKGN